jgi:hypothetical protein
MCEIAPPREGTSPTHPPGRHAVSQLGNLKVIKWQNIFYCQRARKLAFERHFWLRLLFWMRAAESEILKLVASGLHQRALCGLNLSGGAQQIAVIVFLLISSSCVVSSKRGS